MVEIYSDVGGKRPCVADEKKRSPIVADARMAWMWKVGDVFVSMNIKVLKKKEKRNEQKRQNSLLLLFFRACPYFRRCEIANIGFDASWQDQWLQPVSMFAVGSNCDLWSLWWNRTAPPSRWCRLRYKRTLAIPLFPPTPTNPRLDCKKVFLLLPVSPYFICEISQKKKKGIQLLSGEVI